jgi:predicted O-methyltransferase YrrM
MLPVDAALLDRLDRYIAALCAPPDPLLDANLRRAEAAGLPPIQVSPTQGKLLYLLARLARARRILEIGTLAGYSTTWLARALPPGGTIVTLELDPRYAAVARHNLEDAAPGVRIDVREGDAAVQLRAMTDAREEPFDVVFIDADKPRYVEYLDLAVQLAHPGTVVLADNVIRHGAVLDPRTDDANARGARAYNAVVAAHPRLESVILPLIRGKVDGLSVAIVKR